MKKLNDEKKNIFDCFRRNNNHKQLLDSLKDLQAQLNFLIEKSKGKYYSGITSKLSDIGKSSKTYWSILKSFLIGKKIPCVPTPFPIPRVPIPCLTRQMKGSPKETIKKKCSNYLSK